MQIALDGQALGKAILHTGQRLPDKLHAAGIVAGADAVLGNQQITVEILGHGAQHVGQRLRVKLIAHLGKLRALRHRQLAIGANAGAGVVLHAQKIIVLDVGQIVGKFLVPLIGGQCLTAQLRL